MSKSNSSQFERDQFLRQLGFEEIGAGRGTHRVWLHREMQELSKTVNFRIPENLCCSKEQQNPWIVSLPRDPADGTWLTLQKQARWCVEQVRAYKEQKVIDQRRRSIIEEFHQAREDITAWKKSVKYALALGSPIEKAPDSYHKFKPNAQFAIAKP